MKQYGILAYPAKHSLSPIMHNAAFEHLGLKAVYGLYEISPESFEDFITAEVLTGRVHGLSVSLPYKIRVMDFCDQISEDAQMIGAVNTLAFRDGKLLGENTDWIGSNQAIIESRDDLETLEDEKVVVLGAGGSARAIVYGLLKAGAKVVLVNRTMENALKIAQNFEILDFGYNHQIEVYGLDNLDKVDGDILIHTTSLWLQDVDFNDLSNLPSFCNSNFVNQFGVVMDIVYKPLITPLLKVAQDLGKKIITGEKMLLYQAVKQFELWTGEKAPIKVMTEVLKKQIELD